MLETLVTRPNPSESHLKSELLSTDHAPPTSPPPIFFQPLPTLPSIPAPLLFLRHPCAIIFVCDIFRYSATYSTTGFSRLSTRRYPFGTATRATQKSSKDRRRLLHHNLSFSPAKTALQYTSNPRLNLFPTFGSQTGPARREHLDQSSWPQNKTASATYDTHDQ